MHTTESFFARSLRYWRKQRGFSQMDLALEAEVSTRHLSFLETDRSRPGREVVERLLAVLKLETLDQDALLAAAGFPPESALSAPGSEHAVDAGPTGATLQMFQNMLQQQEPYPGFVLNAYGDVPLYNAGARRLLAFFEIDLESASTPAGHANLFELYFAPGGLTQWMDDPERVGRIVFAQVRTELLALNSERAGLLLERLMELAPYLKDSAPPARNAQSSEAVFETVLRKDKRVLRLQSAMAILGAQPAGSPGSTWRLETVFPADEATRRFFEE